MIPESMGSPSRHATAPIALAASVALAVLAGCAPPVVSPAPAAPEISAEPADAESRIRSACATKLQVRSALARIYRIDVKDGLRGIAFASDNRGTKYTCFTNSDGAVVNISVHRRTG